MPLTRYHIRNEYGLADPDVYRSADKDDPEALLEGVAMAGLVGLLRQLGDLAEFAAEIFHDLHEEVMATAARGHGLMVRIQQLEAEFPPIEKAILLQTNHSLYYSNAGIDWHPNLHMEQNLIARGDLPRFVMDSYEESRGPPRLFLLDKFDVAGAGACLKRYTDPSFFKVDTSSSALSTIEVQREKKARKMRKKGSRWRNGETPETVPASHAKLHQLFMEERIENAYNDPTRRVKLKRRQLNGSPFDSKSAKSYMEKFVDSSSPESKTICEVSVAPPSLEWRSDDTSEKGLDAVEFSKFDPIEMSPQENGGAASLLRLQGFVLDDVENFEPTFNGEREEIYSAVEEKELMVHGVDNREGSSDGYHSEEITSEVDNYMDALAIIESEVETDNECRSKHDLHLQNTGKCEEDSDANEEEVELQTEFSASQSIGNTASDDGDSSYEKNSSSLSNQFEGDTSSNGLFTTKSAVTESLTFTDDQLHSEKETLDKEPEELEVSNCIGIEVNGFRDFGDASCSSCSMDFDSTPAPLDARPGLLMELEHEKMSSDTLKHGPGISHPETATNPIDPAAVLLDDGPVQTQDEPDGANAEVSSTVMNRSTDFLELPAETETIGFPTNGILSSEVVLEEIGGNLRTLSPHSLSTIEEQGEFSQLAAVHGLEDCEVTSCLGSSLPRDTDVEGACEVSDNLPAENYENSALQIDEQQLDKIAEKNFSDVDDECYGGGSDEIFQKVDCGNIDDSTSNIDAGVSDNSVLCLPLNISGSDAHPNLSDILVARDDSDELTTLVHEQQVLLDDQEFLSENENVTLQGESPSDVNLLTEVKDCEEIFHEVEKIDKFVCNAEVGERETTLDMQSDKSVTDNPINYDDRVTGQMCTEGLSISDTAPSSDDKVDYLDHPHADFIYPSPITHEESVSGISVPSEAKLDESGLPKWSKEQDIREQANELEAGPPYLASNSSDFISSEEWGSGSHAHFNYAVDDPESLLAEKTQGGISYDDVIAPPGLVLGTTIEQSSHMSCADDVRPELLNLQAAQSQSADLADQEHLFHPKAGTLDDSMKLQDGVFHGEQWQANEGTKLSGHLYEEPQWLKSSIEHQCEDSSPNQWPGDLPNQPPLAEVLNQFAPFETAVPTFGLLSEDTSGNLTDLPPLPPLPPVQWRMGRLQNASLSSETKLPGIGFFGSFPPLQPLVGDEKPEAELPAMEGAVPYENPFLFRAGSGDENLPHASISMSDNLSQDGPNASSWPMPFINKDLCIQSSDPVMEEKHLPTSLLQNPTFNEPSEHLSVSLGSDLKQTDLSTSDMEPKAEDIPQQDPEVSLEKPAQFAYQIHAQACSEVKDLQNADEKAEEDERDSHSSVPRPAMQEEQPHHNLPDVEGDLATPWALPANNESGKPNGSLASNIPRPPKPLIDAVAAHDRSKLRKVAERVRPQLAPKLEERDSMLEQIRTKSFNLKPAVVTRPSIQGPKTNLRVAAILEKANAIRQALAGSDEDDDADSWSDSDS